MLSKVKFALAILFCLGFVAVVSSRRFGGHRKGGGQYVDLDLFLKSYCKGSQGVYERCQRCVAVACIRELDHPRQLRKYQDCIDNHNRCCGPEGFHMANIATAIECYATGSYDSFITGELSTIEALLGSQKSLKDLRLSSKRRGD